ncbi:glycosyltransferase family 2 protein [candidate division KSB1 bacterium]|nr:glycosyltransferase family 2 protein [candidate division KSB1 bacterium]
MNSTSNYKYSFVVPIYNERENLPLLYENITAAMKSISNDYEIVLVDDGSTDGSCAVIQKLAKFNPKVHYLFFNRNHGQTAAFDAGFKAAQGEFIITMDADLQVDAHDLPLLLEKLATHDCVIGIRQKRSDNLIKLISSKIANFVRNKLSGEQIQDTGCPLKVFKREAIQKVKLFHGMHRFFPTLLKLEGCTVAEMPIHHYPRRYGKSKYNVRNRLFRALRDLFAVRWMKSRYLNYLIIQKG